MHWAIVTWCHTLSVTKMHRPFIKYNDALWLWVTSTFAQVDSNSYSVIATTKGIIHAITGMPLCQVLYFPLPTYTVPANYGHDHATSECNHPLMSLNVCLKSFSMYWIHVAFVLVWVAIQNESFCFKREKVLVQGVHAYTPFQQKVWP